MASRGEALHGDKDLLLIAKEFFPSLNLGNFLRKEHKSYCERRSSLGNCCCYFPSFAVALGKATAIFFCFLLFHVNNSAYIYILETTIQHNISETTYIYITNDQLCPKSTIYYKPQVQSSQVQYIKACLHKTDSGSGSRRM